MLPRPERSAPHADAAVMEGMRDWRAAHPQATFAEIEVEATRQVAALRATLIAAALETGEPDTAPDCAACGRTMTRAGTATRKIITSHHERVTVTGHRYRCSTCGVELFPPG